MSRLFYSCLLSILVAVPAFGQDATVADTLDWKRYYPLEIGNRWEYDGMYGSAGPFFRTIVGDTLANGHRYFVQRDSLPKVGTAGPFIHVNYVRYDSAGTVVTVSEVENDTLDVPVLFDPDNRVSVNILMYFDLKTAFNDTLVAGQTDTLALVQGGYQQSLQIGTEEIEVDGQKCFYGYPMFALGNNCYSTDFGLTHFNPGGLSPSDLTFAKINGREYGVSMVRLEGRELPETLGIESIYPNPFKEVTTIVYRMQKPWPATIEVFNSLGQSIWRDEMSIQAARIGRYQLQRQGWPAGLYFVRLSEESGGQIVRSVVVTD